MPHYRRVGDVPPKRHTFHQGRDGARLTEELMGQEGFASSSSLLYHRHSPTAITAASPAGIPRSPLSANEALVPTHLRTPRLRAGGDAVTGRHVLAGNETITICWTAADHTSGLYRNAAGDELVYVQSGRGVLESVFGRLVIGPGDYVVVPASTTHRWAVSGPGPLCALVVEAAGHVGPPPRYLSAAGQFLEHAPYCERDLRGPDEPLVEEGEDVDVLIRHRSGWARHCHARHPFDVVGWDGCVYPYALSIHDFEPIVGRVHQPPSVHQTLVGPEFVVCSFVPRLLDFHPDAVRVPYHHANVDCDEVLFYSGGDFMQSRRAAGIETGSITVHPAGFVHGPQPGSVEAATGQDRTEETAVMIDAFRPLQLSDTAAEIAEPDYPWSWARPVS